MCASVELGMGIEPMTVGDIANLLSPKQPLSHFFVLKNPSLAGKNIK